MLRYLKSNEVLKYASRYGWQLYSWTTLTIDKVKKKLYYKVLYISSFSERGVLSANKVHFRESKFIFNGWIFIGTDVEAIHLWRLEWWSLHLEHLD